MRTLLALLFGLSLALVGAADDKKEPFYLKPENVELLKKSPAMASHVQDILAAYSKDAATGAELWEGKTVAVIGQILGLNEVKDGKYLVRIFATPNSEVKCYVDKADVEELKAINDKLTEEVIFIGTVGKSTAGGSLVFNKCRFIGGGTRKELAPYFEKLQKEKEAKEKK